MKNNRIIARLDIKGPNLVKGIHLEGLRVMGKPETFAQTYYDQGADEIFFQDTVASLYQRNSLTEIITKTAQNIFIPITVGGGLRTIRDINEVLRAGADKVSINTAAIAKPQFINEVSNTFGSSTIVVTVEAIRQPNGDYFAYTDNGREHTGVEIISWVKEIQDRGAGEILLTSIDNDGTGKGYDLDLINKVSSVLEIPLIAHGGAGNYNHIIDCFKNSNVDAIAIASMFHYSEIKNNKNIRDNTFLGEGNTDFLNSNKTYKMFGEASIKSVKKHLIENNFHTRFDY